MAATGPQKKFVSFAEPKSTMAKLYGWTEEGCWIIQSDEVPCKIIIPGSAHRDAIFDVADGLPGEYAPMTMKREPDSPDQIMH